MFVGVSCTKMPKEKTKRRVRIPHPNSRKAAQQTRASYHQSRVERRKKERARAVSSTVNRLMWFREHVNDDKECYTVDEVCQLMEMYLSRHDAELEKLVELQTGRGRLAEHYRLQHGNKEDSLRLSNARERQLFETSGIEIPQLTNKEGLKTFLEWNGEEQYLPKLSLMKFKQSL